MFQTGSEHSAVGIVKKFLNSSPNVPTAGLRINNSFDEETKKALADFQKNKGLSPTGRMNLSTWFAIGAEMNPISIDIASVNDSTVRDLLQMGYGSKFPFTKVNSNNLSHPLIHTNSSSPFALVGGYNFTFRVFVNVFAPFDWFGPLNWSKGDGANRRFGIDPYASYRLQSFSTVIARPGDNIYDWQRKQSATKVANPTKSYLWKPWDRDPAPVYSEGHLRREEHLSDFDRPEADELTHSSDRFKYHFYGNDDAFALWGGNSMITSDIDVHPNINFHYKPDEKDSQKILLRAYGNVIGDQFPAVEVFILDKNSNGVILGVWQIREGDGPVLTRNGGFGIVGDKQLPMIDFDLTTVVEKGIFTGVIKNGRTVSLAEHNKYYTSLPTINPLHSATDPKPTPRPTPTPFQ